MKHNFEDRKRQRVRHAKKQSAQTEAKKIGTVFLQQNGFRINKWKDEGVTYEDYIIDNKHVKIEVYGEAPEVDINANGDWITVPNCKTEDDLKALLKLFGFPGNNNKTV